MRRKCNSTQVISPFNLYNFLMQNEYRIVMITGLAIIMLGGEIDLSLGYQISLVGILIGKLLTADVPVPICILIGLAAGCCCGLLNGFLIAGLNLSSVIVTLITQKLFQGISYLLSKGMTYSDFPEPIMSISGMKGSTMPAGHIIMILSILFLEGMFCFTILGKNILSMGYDEQVLRQNGIPVGKYKLSAYILGSFFFAVAALLLISRQGLAVSNMGNGLEVDGMFAVCIAGGASLILKNSEVKRRVPISNFYLGHARKRIRRQPVHLRQGRPLLQIFFQSRPGGGNNQFFFCAGEGHIEYAQFLPYIFQHNFSLHCLF